MEQKNSIAILAAGAAVISFSSIFSRLSEASPAANGFYRMLFGLLFFIPVVVLYAKRKGKTGIRPGRPVALASIAGFFLAIDMYLWHTSIELIGPGLATLIANFQVFFLAGYDTVLFKKPPSPKLKAALVLAVAGLYILIGRDWGSTGSEFKSGVFFGLAAAFNYSLFFLFLKKSGITGELNNNESMAVVSVSSGIVLGIIAFTGYNGIHIPNTESLIWLVLYGLICQGFGWMVVTTGMKGTSLSVAGLMLLLQPTLAWVWDVMIFDKPFYMLDVAGAALSLAAIYLGTVREA
ncbi:DMT family transporter [Limisalsivibrio acetivorans]|uniref:DMT family transporter n=1 Tax=Limisalsivibrio acetivorans TaxID=1304888 RepID=UPI0003B5A093|nr:DMT family transporter [Limisalsivibrio acetivorans]